MCSVESMEKVCISVCVLVVCAVFVAGFTDGNVTGPALSTGHNSTESNMNAVTRVVAENSAGSRKQTPEKIERDLAIETRGRVDLNTSIREGKQLSAETFHNGIISVPVKWEILDKNRMESQTLITGNIVNNSKTEVDNLESTTYNYVTDNYNKNVAEYTAANGFRDDKMQKKGSNDAGIIPVVGNNVVDKGLELVVNTNRNSRDLNQLQRDNVDNMIRQEEGLQMTTNTQTFNKPNNSKEKNVNNIDAEENIIKSVTEDTGNYQIMNDEYKLLMNSTVACNRLLSVVITKWQMLGNGSLLSLDGIPVMYPPDLFWEDLYDNVTEIRGCICELRNCIRKCCPEGQTLLEDGMCVDSNSTLLHPFSPQFTDENNKSVTNIDVFILYGNPCQIGVYRLDDENDVFALSPTGVLNVPAEGNFTAAEYCLEAFENPEKILPLLCFTDDEEVMEKKEETGMLYAVGMIISVPFLFATFLVYSMIHELRNLHGKSLMCHVSSLLTAYIFLAIVQLGSTSLSNAFCIFCAFIIFFAFHACFFWLNVMCFDIWWTFSGLRPFHGTVKEREHKKFIVYSIYAWGSPFVMLLVCMMMDLVPGMPSEYIKPEFGVKKCWFRSDIAVLAYFFGPIGVLVLCNIVLFVTTAVKIMKLKRETRMLQGEESKRHDNEADTQRFNLYLKLFIVMGINWVMELISWAIGGPKYLWYLTDLGNTLQGVLIFIIFVWKPKILRLLERRFRRTKSSGSPFSSTAYRPALSHTSSYTFTTRASESSHDQFHMKPIGESCTSDVP